MSGNIFIKRYQEERAEEVKAVINNSDKEFPEFKQEDMPTEDKYLVGTWKGYMDGYLKANINAARRVIKKDWDMVFCVDGYEGTGKSALAQQLAWTCDNSFNIDRVCFQPKEFVDQINKAQPYQAIVYDEAYQGMASRSAMGEVNKMLMSVLAEIRQKNLFVFIILPCFFELDKYAAVWRSRALIHTYTGKDFERGFFSFYNQDRKKSLYVLGKKFYSYKQPPPNFFGRFPKGYTVDEKEYRKKKLKALTQREPKKELTAQQRKWVMQRNLLINKSDLTTKELSKLLDLTNAEVCNIKRKFSASINEDITNPPKKEENYT